MTAAVANNARMLLKRLFAWKVRGVRWVEIIGVVLVALVVFSVYLAKAGAARQSAKIDGLERQIAENAQRVRLLKAETARLEQPGRLEALSRGAGLGPMDVHKQGEETALPGIAAKAPAPAAQAAPVAMVATPVETPTPEPVADAEAER